MANNRKPSLPIVRNQQEIRPPDENLFDVGHKITKKAILDSRRSTLFIHRHDDNVKRLHDNLFMVSTKYAAIGHVLFFTTKKVERVSDGVLAQFSDHFKRIIFFYIQSIDKLLEKLLELQRWENCLPQMIIIESLDNMTIAEGVTPESQHALVMACLADTVQTISSKLKTDIKSIITINDTTFNEFPIEIFARESYVADESKLSDYTTILSILAEKDL